MYSFYTWNLTQQEYVMTAIQEMITLLYKNPSTVHSPRLYKYAPCCFNVAAKTRASKTQSAVLDYKGDVGAYLLPSESEGTSSDLEFDTDN
jgi:hypothetical protein